MFKMSNKEKKKLIYRLITAILVIVICFCSFVIGKSLYDDSKSRNEINMIYNIVKETSDGNSEFTKESFRALKNENSDLMGYIKWDSDIIEQPILQSYDNDFYLHKKFDKTYYESGSIFMDYNSKLSDSNIIVYGHNNSYNPEIMFSHLNDIILDQKYYEMNDRFTVYTQNDIREYAICYAYYFTEEEYQDYDFMQSDFSSKQDFDAFIAFPKAKSKITSRNGDIEYGNNFITLQTCKRYNQDIKVMIVAKEILVRQY